MVAALSLNLISAMNKKILILSVLILFLPAFVFPSKVALAQDVNYAGLANNGVASESSSMCYTSFDHIFKISSCSTSGAVSDTNDNNTATYWKRQSYCGILKTADYIYSSFTIEITFDEVAPQINNVKYWIDWYNHTAYQASGLPSAHSYGRSLSCSLYYSGGWNEIGTSQSSSVDISGSWSDVTKVRIYMYTWTKANNNPSFGRMQAWAAVTLYELEAWGSVAGPAYIDIGLRVYNGTETIKIACCDPDGAETSPLKIVGKDGITYDVALVKIGDAMDSGVRIQTSSEIKALRKYE